MFALGAVNVAAGLVSGFPVSSSGSRTAIGDTAGARSQLHSLAALVVVAIVLLIGGPVISSFPRAALGALVIFAAMRLIDLAEFHRIAGFRRTELALALITTCAVLMLGVLPGVLVAVGMSILDLLRRVSRPHDGVLGYAPGLAGMHDIDDYPVWSSTATTPHCASPTRRTSAAAHWQRSTGHRPRRPGCCSTPRRWWRSTSPPPTCCTSCVTSWTGGR
jgi:MFS superfamily sulfate permease-like transporter